MIQLKMGLFTFNQNSCKIYKQFNFFKQENSFPLIEGRLEQLDAYINNGTSMPTENFGESLILHLNEISPRTEKNFTVPERIFFGIYF
jgi:hypothetical protein